MLNNEPSNDAELTLRTIRAAQFSAGINLALAAVKIFAGIVGTTYALVADGVESLADVASSLIVWGGIAVGARPPDDDHPYGHGKAESVAAALVSFLLIGAAIFIAVHASYEIRTPHAFPAVWTLGLLLIVSVVKLVMARRISALGSSSGSVAVEADAAHHLGDAITSGAAFIGISAALIGRHMGGGPQWAAADDWAAVFAACVIAWNGSTMAIKALHDLMDRSPGEVVLGPVRAAALDVPGVCHVEKLAARRVGTGYRVTVHVQASPTMSLSDAHDLGGRVKRAITAAGLRIHSVLVHMEPYEDDVADSPSNGSVDVQV
jgi:cation diffusion facilitator family transporter